MEQKDLDGWGAELGAGDFARALAFLSVQLFEKTPGDVLAKFINSSRWSPALISDPDDDEPATLRLCFDPAFHPPSQLPKPDGENNFSGEWDLLVGKLKADYQQRQKERQDANPNLEDRPFNLRLEVYTTQCCAPWLIRQLSHPNVGASSIYLRVDEPSADISWNWPLKIGFLADEKSQLFCQRLKEEMSSWSWVKPLLDIVTVGSRVDSCDLLLFEQDPSHVIDLLRANGTLYADCVLFIGTSNKLADETPTLANAVRQVVKTSGVGFANIPTDDMGMWLVELIRELSHDRPFDVALFDACRVTESLPPVLIASRALIRFSTLSESIKSLGEDLVKRSNRTRSSLNKIRIEPEDAGNLQIDSKNYGLGEAGEMLTRSAKNINFSRESSSAKSVSNIKRQLDEIMAKAEPVPQISKRWIQAQVYDLSEKSAPVLLKKALHSGAAHKLVVRIGTASDEWESHPEEFPTAELPRTTKANRLTVVFTEPQLEMEPKSSSIDLPQQGNSTECSFFFSVPPEVKNIEARISVLYKNRVLQTSLLKAQVHSDPNEQTDAAFEMASEVIVRPGFSDLGRRRHFDAAFILNHDSQGPSITSIRDEYVSFYKPEELNTFVERVDAFLQSVAEEPEKYNGPLNTEATVDLLRDLAKRGGLFYESLKDHQDGDSPLAGSFFDSLEDRSETKRTKFIQVISANPDTRLPLEFIYDRKTPGANATLCSSAVEGLKQGNCPAECEGLKDPVNHVCPMGFWGLSTVIERHTHSIKYTPKTVDGDFRFQTEPVEGRDHLNLFKGVLLAASDKANVKITSDDPLASVNGVDDIISAVKKVIRSVPPKVRSWEDWCEHIKTESPSTLILVTHTKSNKGLLALEIEDGSATNMLLEADNIESEYVRAEKSQPPLVMLMGCETGSSEVDFMGFVAKFRRKGAAMVVSTGAKIRARHVIPVTVEFINMLDEYSRKESASFGEVMRIVKQKLLARGIPMVLTLMSYGDADWNIGKP